MRRIIHDFMHYNPSVAHNLAGRLEKALAPKEWDLLRVIARESARLRLPLYAVGGLPRDLILGIPGGDFDLVVEGPAAALAAALASKYGGRVVVHRRFGTAKWDLHGVRINHQTAWLDEGEHQLRGLDFVTARSETYKHPGALPTVTPGSIDDDLRRRDFSINAVAIRLDGAHWGQVRDDFDGWDDIRGGHVRVLHKGSFIDDPTRMYRAVRYEQRYGFRIAAGTRSLIPQARQYIESLSGQRLRHELDLILDEPFASAMLRRLAELDLLAPIAPALYFDRECGRRLDAAVPRPTVSVPRWPRHEVGWLLWLMGLPRADIESVNKRLHFGGALYRALLASSDVLPKLEVPADLAPSQWVERLDPLPLVAVYAVYLAAPASHAEAALEKYLAEWRHIRPSVTGHDLRNLGIEPGAAYKRILTEIRRAWLNGRITTHEQEHELLHELVRSEAGLIPGGHLLKD